MHWLLVRKVRLSLFSSGYLYTRADSITSKGSICDCGKSASGCHSVHPATPNHRLNPKLGIPYVEKLSREFRSMILSHGVPSFGEMQGFFNDLLSPDEQVELAVRAALKGQVLGIDMPKGRDPKVKKLLDVVFPIFGSTPARVR